MKGISTGSDVGERKNRFIQEEKGHHKKKVKSITDSGERWSF